MSYSEKIETHLLLYNHSISLITWTLDPGLVVYRGQTITKVEMDIFQRNIGNLLSMNSFVSTTPDRDMALIYSGQDGQQSQLESVVFKIILPNKCSLDIAPFADISHLSQLPGEQERLIAMGSVFRLESIESDSVHNCKWIRLSMCTCDDTRFTKMKNYSHYLIEAQQTNELKLIVNLVSCAYMTDRPKQVERLIELGTKRATELSSSDPGIDMMNNLLQWQRSISSYGYKDLTHLDHLNPALTTVEVFLQEQANVFPETQSLIPVLQDSLSLLRSTLNSCSSDGSLGEETALDADEILNKFFPDLLRRLLDQIKDTESSLPADHPYHSYRQALQPFCTALRNELSTTTTFQFEHCLKLFQDCPYIPHEIRQGLIFMQAIMAKVKDDKEEAFDLFMQLLDSPNITMRSQANLNIAELLEDRGDIESACEFLTNVIDTPELRLDSVERCEALERRARLKEELGKWKESFEDYLILRDLRRLPSSNSTVFDDYDEEITRLQQKLHEEHNTSE